MNKVLILFAHPLLEKSWVNKTLIKNLPKSSDLTFHDLYENYPDFNVNVNREKELLTDNQIIIWQHPFYWYSCPPLMKQWIDMVLEFGWAYGPGGTSLAGKYIFNIITTGGTKEVYNKSGYNRYTIREFLVPFEQTATLCKMKYLPPFAIQGTHRLNDEQMQGLGKEYGRLVDFLLNASEEELIRSSDYQMMNEFTDNNRLKT